MQLGNMNASQSGQQTTPGYTQIKIDHSSGEFYIRGNGDFHPVRSLQVIPLGLIRSRTYWKQAGFSLATGESGKKPACKSHDALTGIPNRDLFPWDESEFANVASNVQLSCDACTFKGFISGESQPRCKQTWTIPCIETDLGNRLYGDSFKIFVIDFTASSIPALTEYLTPYRDRAIPAYSRFMKIHLRKVSKGDRVFTKAEFTESLETNERLHPQFSTLLHEVRDFMQPKDEGRGFKPLTLGSV